jgi:hypothetical protein
MENDLRVAMRVTAELIVFGIGMISFGKWCSVKGREEMWNMVEVWSRDCPFWLLDVVLYAVDVV